MVGRPNNIVDVALAASVDSMRRNRSMSVRELAAILLMPKSTLHRFLKSGTLPRNSRDVIDRFLLAVDSDRPPEVEKRLSANEEELLGHMLKASQKLVTLLSQFDAMVRGPS